MSPNTRAYLYRDRCLTQLTRDHTLAQQHLDAGHPVLTASWHRILTNCLGVADHEIEVEFHYLRLSGGDRLVLCTDGLIDMVPDGDIADLLGLHAGSQEAADALVGRALEGGGRDNVTVVVARYEMADEDAEAG